MIICAALGVDRRQYHSVSQLHPLDEQVLGVPALLANGHAHGMLYVCTCIGASTMRNGKKNNNYLFYPQTIAKYLATAPANKEIRVLRYWVKNHGQSVVNTKSAIG